MATTIVPRRRKRKGLSPFEAAFVDLYLTSCRGNATQAARLAGCTMQGAALMSYAYKVLHRPHVQRVVGRALAERTPSDEELLGRMGQIAMTRSFEKGVLSAGDAVKAAELVLKVKGRFRDPIEAIILRQAREMARPLLPAGVVGLLEEGEREAREVLVSALDSPSARSSSTRPHQAAPRRRASTRRRQAQVIEAEVIPERSSIEAGQAGKAGDQVEEQAGHDAVQHEPMTQCVTPSPALPPPPLPRPRR